MAETERQLLKECAQTRIESHFRRYVGSIDPDIVAVENEKILRFYAACEDLPEETQKIAEEYDKLMFQIIAAEEQQMYYAGFRDGVRAAKLFRDMENEPL